jgi:hypothetical protein
MEFPSREDWDNEWNFVYFSHSYNENMAFAYVYFSHSDVSLTNVWENNVKRNPINNIFFRLGGCNPNT